MTGDELQTYRSTMMMTQGMVAQMCLSAGPMTATDIQTAEALGAATITNALLNAACERVFRVAVNYIPGPIT